MSDSLATLRKKINRAHDLQSVVRTMKAAAASSIGQYEKALISLADYSKIINLGFSNCLRSKSVKYFEETKSSFENNFKNVVLFGSDQGLVGQFNDLIVDYTNNMLKNTHHFVNLWVIGERAYSRIHSYEFNKIIVLPVPSSIAAITSLINTLLIDIDNTSSFTNSTTSLTLMYNTLDPKSIFIQKDLTLLPFDTMWINNIRNIKWPTAAISEVFGDIDTTLHRLIREYLFISFFRVCTESLASENMCRMLAMQRADKNITDLIETLHNRFHRLRKENIDAELFDVIAGFESILH